MTRPSILDDYAALGGRCRELRAELAKAIAGDPAVAADAVKTDDDVWAPDPGIVAEAGEPEKLSPAQLLSPLGIASWATVFAESRVWRPDVALWNQEMQHCIRERRFYPTPAEIRERRLAVGKTPRALPGEAE